jgi:hypothetical protein
MRRSLFLVPVLCAALAGIGCQEQGTEIVFEVSTGYLMPEQVSVASITVLGLGPGMTPDSPDACRDDRTIRLGAGGDAEESPFTFSVRAGDLCNERVFFKITLIKDALDVVTSGGTEYFVSGQSKRVRVSIPRNSTCSDGQQWCSTACVDVVGANENCGWCGNACEEGLSCVGGWCRCPDGKSDCGGECIDTQADPANCGGCGNACGDAEVCVGGSCQAGCPGEFTQCGGRCVDTMADPRNCGGCGNDCGADARCEDGSCGTCRPPQGGQCDPLAQCGCPTGWRCDAAQEPYLTPTEICVPAGMVEAGAYCDSMNLCAPGLGCFRGIYGAVREVPPSGKVEANGSGTCLPWCVIGDPAGCGSNPSTCRELQGQMGMEPRYGACLPFGGMEVCNWIDDDGNGMADDGVNIWWDPSNCGECFHTCDPMETCRDGLGQGCAPPWQACSAGCTDTSSDPNNCGACDMGCGMAETCFESSCAPDCASFLPICPSDPTPQNCTDTNSDPDNCGWCGALACPPGQACVYGGCSATCLDEGQTVCDRRCVDTESDPHNCSSCGATCGTGQGCSGSSCMACDPAAVRAGGECYVPTQCGCAANEGCMLTDDGTGYYTETCQPRFGEMGELWAGCHLTLADCAPGLQCVPTDIPHENRCFRLCTGDGECPSGKCMLGADATFDPYGVCRAVGGPCMNDSECPGEAPICVTRLLGGIDVPGGYCTVPCDPTTERCPPGSRCIRWGAFDRAEAVCLATCIGDGDCRDGYSCAPGLGNVCVPLGG